MIPNAWSKSLYCLDNFGLEHCTTEQLSSWHRNPMPSTVSVPALFFNSSDSASNLVFSSTSGHLPARRLQALSSSCGQNDQNPSRGRQAKRARVENIIQSMNGSPGAQFSEAMTNLYGEIPEDESREHDNLTLEMMANNQSQYQHLRQLATSPKVKNEETNISERFVEEASYWDASSTLSRNSLEDLYNEPQSDSNVKSQGWRKQINYSQSKSEKVKLMADVLKCELSKAVSTSVDSIFKSAPLLQMSPKQDDARDSGTPLLNPLMHPSICRDHSSTHSYYETTSVQAPVFQTEALSLVIQKDHSDTVPHRHPKLKHELLEKSSKSNTTKSLRDGCLETGQTKAIDRSWYALKVRSKVNSIADRSSKSHTVDHMLLESLHLPRMKSPQEMSSLVKRMYMLNEGLTTNHLKKAKLMFFYTRYPSSPVLKMCFGDVQFTRCITSQLIKWFSNFREFYYIQMEKFARHAVIEGVSDQRDLTVGRESELFRVLNLHYNKTNDFQVPDRFLEVAGITLREFYVAISLGKDCDPSWKKAIYRVICKLDSDVPAHFKTIQSK